MSRIFKALERAEQERKGDRRDVFSTLLPPPPTTVDDRRPAPPAITEEFERFKVMFSLAAVNAGVSSAMLISTRSGEGISTVTLGLGAALAAGAARGVLLIDLPGSRHGVADRLRLPPRPGLAEVLRGEIPWSEAVVASPTPRLFVLLRGAAPADFGQARWLELMDELLADVRSSFDYVLLEAGAVRTSPESLLIARHVDGVILVVEPGRTTVEAAQETTTQLRNAGAKLLGVLLNRRRTYVPRFLARRLAL